MWIGYMSREWLVVGFAYIVIVDLFFLNICKCDLVLFIS
jgi:hypothetical protein